MGAAFNCFVPCTYVNNTNKERRQVKQTIIAGRFDCRICWWLNSRICFVTTRNQQGDVWRQLRLLIGKGDIHGKTNYFSNNCDIISFLSSQMTAKSHIVVQVEVMFCSRGNTIGFVA